MTKDKYQKKKKKIGWSHEKCFEMKGIKKKRKEFVQKELMIVRRLHGTIFVL